MAEIIKPRVSERIITKADRLFTGTLDGRVIEILQNARRAGATEVYIKNEDGFVTVQDNGKGIEDFAKLLYLGASGWDEHCEEGEDPAGIGLFSLFRREVTIRSQGKIVTITEKGWTTAPSEVKDDPEPVCEGTILRFKDELWDFYTVNKRAVFTGMQVIVDGISCKRFPFVSEKSTHLPEFGCKIEVLKRDALNDGHWYTSSRYESENILINFHGQVVDVGKDIIRENLTYLVEMTGEPTGLRLMLPARTRVVENDVWEKLLDAIEVCAYRFIQAQGSHRLSYKSYLRAKELGIELPEADPSYYPGVLPNENPAPPEVFIPKDFPLSECYRFDGKTDDEEENTHLLSALGKFEKPFVLVEIDSQYNGYSWSNLKKIENVKIESGEVIASRHIWDGHVTLVKSLTLTAITSDGEKITSPVCMAVDRRSSNSVLVTAEAENLGICEIWHFIGGYNDDYDYDPQYEEVSEEIESFWADQKGPHEHIRQKLYALCCDMKGWEEVSLANDGRMKIRFKDGREENVSPPFKAA